MKSELNKVRKEKRRLRHKLKFKRTAITKAKALVRKKGLPSQVKQLLRAGGFSREQISHIRTAILKSGANKLTKLDLNAWLNQSIKIMNRIVKQNEKALRTNFSQ